MIYVRNHSAMNFQVQAHKSLQNAFGQHALHISLFFIVKMLAICTNRNICWWSEVHPASDPILGILCIAVENRRAGDSPAKEDGGPEGPPYFCDLCVSSSSTTGQRRPSKEESISHPARRGTEYAERTANEIPIKSSLRPLRVPVFGDLRENFIR